MRIILTQDVPHLGSLGDEVSVRDGYARNYLLPQGMALLAGSRNARHLAHKRRHLDRLREQAIVSARAEAEKVANLVLELPHRAGANGRLFGSVTNRDVQAALSRHGYEVDRKAIQLGGPIRSVGTHHATVKLHSEVKTDITIRVVPHTEEGAKESVRTAAEEAEAAEGAAAEAAAAEEAEAEAGFHEATPAEIAGEAPTEESAEETAEG